MIGYLLPGERSWDVEDYWGGRGVGERDNVMIRVSFKADRSVGRAPD